MATFGELATRAQEIAIRKQELEEFCLSVAEQATKEARAGGGEAETPYEPRNEQGFCFMPIIITLPEGASTESPIESELKFSRDEAGFRMHFGGSAKRVETAKDAVSYFFTCLIGVLNAQASPRTSA